MLSFVWALYQKPGNVGCTCFQTEMAEMAVKIHQGRWQWHISTGHTSHSISGL